jgi:NTE family protein
MRKIIILTIALISSGSAMSQPYENLVLEGGGVRGIAYAGSVRCLEEAGMMTNVKKVAGTSAGAIAALAISLGYTSTEIEDLIHRTKVQKFNDGRFMFIGGVARMNKYFGWYRGRVFTQWVEEIIENKTGNPDLTFREMHDMGFIDLYVTGTSLNNQRLIVFSYETYPDMKVKDAVRISMSIPMYFEAVFIDECGTVLDSRHLPEKYDLMVDGGLTGNYPIGIFDPSYVENGFTTRVCNPATIGLRLDSPPQVGSDSVDQSLAPIQITNFKDYVSAFYNYVVENLNRTTLTPDDWQRTVSISTGGISPRIRRLSDREKDLLINNGYDAMNRFTQKAEAPNP